MKLDFGNKVESFGAEKVVDQDDKTQKPKYFTTSGQG